MREGGPMCDQGHVNEVKRGHERDLGFHPSDHDWWLSGLGHQSENFRFGAPDIRGHFDHADGLNRQSAAEREEIVI